MAVAVRLRVGVRPVDGQQDGVAGADAHGVAELLLGRRRSEREDGHRAAVGLGQLHGGLHGALLVGAGREAEVGRVDGLLVGRQVDPGPRRRHPFDADQQSHGARTSRIWARRFRIVENVRAQVSS